MIEHPAFPKLPQPTHLNEQLDGEFMSAEIHGAEIAFRSLVKWLEEPCVKHSQDAGPNRAYCPEHRYRCPECQQSLRKAAGLEGNKE